jgi:rhodanese-related sulfurtransferase
MSRSITIEEAKKKFELGCPVIDVRTPAEYRGGHVVRAVNIPLNEIDPQKIKSLFDHQEVLIICQAGTRGENACTKLESLGFTSALNISGGTSAWIQSGLPIEKDEMSCGVISIDRQVRIAAGSLVLAGIILHAVTSQSGWLMLSGFVGAGLVFAGMTNTCGMALILAKMPWNK